ncbi:MAG: hypothetical protein R3D25_03175 [Geminicoccaceae bacterium]
MRAPRSSCARDLFLHERDYRLHGGIPLALGAALADVVTTLGELASRLPGRSAAAWQARWPGMSMSR